MVLGGSGELLCESVATITQALMHLEVGQLALLKFGTKVQVLHHFTDPFTEHAAVEMFTNLTFKQQKTDMAHFLGKSVEMLEVARQQQINSTNNNNTMQLMIIVSDGEFGSERKNIRQILRRAKEDNIFCVFLIIDKAATQSSSSTASTTSTPKKPKQMESILDIQSVSYTPDGKIAGMVSYMDNFPFPYYIILRKLSNLPMVLGDALRQWFETINVTL